MDILSIKRKYKDAKQEMKRAEDKMIYLLATTPLPVVEACQKGIIRIPLRNQLVIEDHVDFKQSTVQEALHSQTVEPTIPVNKRLLLDILRIIRNSHE